VITCARSPLALELARALHRAGHVVFVADSWKVHVCSFSNAVERSFVIPSPRDDSEGFTEALVTIATDEHIDILIPVIEEAIYLSRVRDRFPEWCKIFCEPFEGLRDLHNKWLFFLKLRSRALATPYTTLIRSLEDLDHRHFSGSYVLKPCCSRGAQKLRVVAPQSTPRNIDVRPGRPWIAQEWVEGRNWSSYSWCQDGAIKSHVAYPMQFAIDGFSCLNFEAVDHPGIAEWVRNFVAEEGYTGHLAFDFIEEENGNLMCIECNPRATSGLHLVGGCERFGEVLFDEDHGVVGPEPGSACQIAFGMLLYGWKSPQAVKEPWKFLKNPFQRSRCDVFS